MMAPSRSRIEQSSSGVVSGDEASTVAREVPAWVGYVGCCCVPRKTF